MLYWKRSIPYLSVLPILAFLFFSNVLRDPDSYLYLTYLKGLPVTLPDWDHVFFIHILNFLQPFFLSSGLMAAKGVLVILFALSLLAILLIGKELKFTLHPWLLLPMAPIFFMEFMKFEGEQFAYPILLFSLLFLLRHSRTGEWADLLPSYFLFGLALLFWRGAILLVPAWILVNPWSLLLAVPFLLKIQEIFSYVFTRDLAWESLGLLALPQIALFAPAFLAEAFWPITLLFFTALVVLKLKYLFWAVLFFMLGNLRMFSFEAEIYHTRS